MNLRLRQLCLVAESKAKVVEDFAALFDLRPVHGSDDLSRYGLPACGPMSEQGRALLAHQGIENVIFAAGADFIEVLFPTHADATAERYRQRRGGDTGYMIILQADDVDRYARRAEAESVRIVHRADFPDYRDIHLHAKDAGGALLSVARHWPDNEIDGAWYPAGTAWRTQPPSQISRALAAAELQSPDPARLAQRWGRLLELPIAQRGADSVIALDDGELRFVTATDGRGEGFAGIDLRVANRQSTLEAARRRGCVIVGDIVILAGLRWRLVE